MACAEVRLIDRKHLMNRCRKKDLLRSVLRKATISSMLSMSRQSLDQVIEYAGGLDCYTMPITGSNTSVVSKHLE